MIRTIIKTKKANNTASGVIYPSTRGKIKYYHYVLLSKEKKELLVNYMSVGVTFFFDISKLEDAIDGLRNDEFYKTNCVATLSIQYPLVIFCSPIDRGWIETIRMRCAPGIKTVYVEKNITEYDFYKVNFKSVKQNKIGKKIGRVTASYTLTTMFKYQALKMAKDIIPDASHYIWVDFGCQYIVWEAKERLDAIFKNPSPKISACYINYRSNEDLKDIKKYLDDGPCAIAMGICTVENSYVDPFFHRAMMIIYEQLANGVGHADEQIVVYIYDRWPEMFTLFYGDYYSLAANYHKVTRDYHAIRWYFIQKALNNGKLELARTAAKAVLETYDTNSKELSDDTITLLKTLVNK